MKIVIYPNVKKDSKGRIRTPYGIAQFRSYIIRNFINSDQPYTHPVTKAVEGDIIVWAFRDENTVWYLLGDGFVSYKAKNEGYWEFWIEGARLYPRSVPIDDLSFAEEVIKSIHVGSSLKWKQYRELLEEARKPLV